MAIVINIASQADLSAFQKAAQVMQQARQQSQQATAGNQAAGQSANTYNPKQKPPQVEPTMFEKFKFLDAANKATGGGFQGQRNQALADAYNAAAQHAQSTGDPKAISQMGQLANQIQKLNGGGGGGFMQSLGTLLSNSRFGKGGLQPRVGDAMDLLGKAGPLGAAVGMGASIITGFAAAVSRAADSINQFTSGMLAAQTSASTYSRVSGFSGLFGGDPTQVAKSFVDRAKSDPWAARHATQAGINPYMPEWSQDYGDAFERIAKSFQGLSFKDAQMKANQMGNPELAKLSFLNENDYKTLKKILKPISDEDMKAAGRFSTYAGVAQESLNQTLNKMASVFLPAATKGLQEFAGVMSGITTLIDKVKDEKWFKIALGAMGNGEAGWEATKSVGLGGAGKAIWDWLNASGTKDNAAKATRDNTAELRKLNANMRENGIYGGGSRAQRAVPRKVRGTYLNDAAYRKALSTGLA